MSCASASKESKSPKTREVAERSPAPAAEPAGDLTPDVIVGASFETSAFALKPGSKFWLAAHFKIHDGYRISWKNPGEVGKPTLARFRVPEGFVVSEVLYPAPRRFVLNGELISYGYQSETALFAEVLVPEGLNEQTPYRFEMEAEWYACKISRARMKEFMQRRDGPAIRDTLIWFGAMAFPKKLTMGASCRVS